MPRTTSKKPSRTKLDSSLEPPPLQTEVRAVVRVERLIRRSPPTKTDENTRIVDRESRNGLTAAIIE